MQGNDGRLNVAAQRLFVLEALGATGAPEGLDDMQGSVERGLESLAEQAAAAPAGAQRRKFAHLHALTDEVREGLRAQIAAPRRRAAAPRRRAAAATEAAHRGDDRDRDEAPSEPAGRH